MKKKMLIILGVAASVRILFSIPSFMDKNRVYSIADAAGYELLAVNLLEHKVFSLSENPPYQPDLLRTPLYPLCISGIYSIFGHRPRIIIILQMSISALTALLVYVIGRKIYPRIAFPGAILFGLSLNSAFYSTMLLTEVLFTFLLIAGIFLLVRSLDSDSPLTTLFSGFLFGLSTLTRPIGLYFPLIMSIPILWTFRRKLRKGASLLTIFFLRIFCDSLTLDIEKSEDI